MATTMKVVRDAVADRLNPAMEVVEGNMRHARRALTHRQQAVEDFAASTALQIRRHPLAAVALVGAAGAVIGWMGGFILGWQTSRLKNHARD